MADKAWEDLGAQMGGGAPALEPVNGTVVQVPQAPLPGPVLAPHEDPPPVTGGLPGRRPPPGKKGTAAAPVPVPGSQIATVPWRKPGYFHSPLDTYVAHATRCKVWKVDGTGHANHVGSYSFQDLDRFHDVDDFLSWLAKGSGQMQGWGPGEFLISLVLSNGHVTQQLPYHIGDPSLFAPAANVQGDKIDRAMAKIEELVTAKGGNDPSMMSLLFELRELRRQPAASPPAPITLPPPGPDLDVPALITSIAAMNKSDKPEGITVRDVMDLIEKAKPKDTGWSLEKVSALVGLAGPWVEKFFSAMTEPLKKQAEITERQMEAIADELAEMRKRPVPTVKDMFSELQAVQDGAAALGFRKDSPGFGDAIVQIVKELPRVFDSAGSLAERIRAKEAAEKAAAKPAQKPAPVNAPAGPGGPPPERPIKVPPVFQEWLQKCRGDDATRSEAIVNAFAILLDDPDPRWREQVSEMIKLAFDDGKKKELLAWFRESLETIAKNPVLSQSFPEAEMAPTIAAVEKNLDLIIEFIRANVEEPK